VRFNPDAMIDDVSNRTACWIDYDSDSTRVAAQPNRGYVLYCILKGG